MTRPSFPRRASLLAIGLLVSLSPAADSSWRQVLQFRQPTGITRAPERHSSMPVGLRRIQRRPELIDPLDNDSTPDELIEPPNILTRAALELLPQSYKRSSGMLDGPATSEPAQAPASSEFLYVIAPISEQALPFQSSKVDQGYKNFVNLPGPNYETGLQRLSIASSAVDDRSKMTAPASQASNSAGCRATRTKTRVTRDEFDPSTGQLLRQCGALVELTSCEGHCVSSIQPSVRMPSGFIKKCSCCNEGSMKQVLIRLHECWSAGVQSQARQLPGYMDVLVNEPTECKCRPCDTLV